MSTNVGYPEKNVEVSQDQLKAVPSWLVAIRDGQDVLLKLLVALNDRLSVISDFKAPEEVSIDMDNSLYPGVIYELIKSHDRTNHMISLVEDMLERLQV